MVLAFPAFRRGYFKVTGSVIDAALKRGHDVRLLWHEHSGKPGEDVLLTEVAARWPKATVDRIDRDRWYMSRFCYTAYPGGAMIGPSLHAMPGFADELRYSLDYAWEQITTPAAAMAPGDIHLCFVSEYQRAMYNRLMRLDITAGFHPADRLQHVTGSTMLDAFDVVRPDDVRARYCLPHGQPVVLFMALKFGVPHAWRRWWYRYTGYHRLVRAVRRYCDDAGALLVVKTREKNLDPWFLRRYADRYVADEDLWPYTSAQLLSVANLCIHFQSGAAIEAARAGVLQLSVRIPQPHLAGFPGHAEVYMAVPRVHSAPSATVISWKAMQHWDGVVWSTDYTSFARYPMPGPDEYPQRLRVDAEARSAYLDRFCGPPNAAERVLNLVEREGRE